MKKKNLKVGIIGILPPPYGGITIHVKRLFDFLDSEGINVKIIDEYKGFKIIYRKIKNYGGLLKYLKSSQFANNIYHYHSPNRFVRLLIGVISIFGLKTVITLHGEGIKFQIDNHGFLWRKFYLFALKRIKFIICDNEDLQKFIIEQGISPHKTIVISAFIPPIINLLDNEDIPLKIEDFYQKNKITIFAMGWIKFHNGVDLYGLDMILKLAEKLNILYSNQIGIVIKLLLSEIQDHNYYKEWNLKINKLLNVLVITEDMNELYPLERNASIVIRPSCTDGDSLSIRESLYFGTPVITSDAIPRPEGCILFHNRDYDDFELKTILTIEKVLNSEKIVIPDQFNNAEKILGVYYSLCSK